MNPIGPKESLFYNSQVSTNTLLQKVSNSNENSATHEFASNKLEEEKLAVDYIKLSLEKNLKEQLTNLALNPSISQKEVNEEKAFKLISEGVFPDDDRIKIILWTKAILSSSDRVKLLQERKFFFNLTGQPTTPLHFATLYGSFETFKYVLENCQIPVDHLDGNGNTALANLCNSDMIEKNEKEAQMRLALLLSAGANSMLPDSTGNIPLLSLCKRFWNKENKEVPIVFFEPFRGRMNDIKMAIEFYEVKEKKEHNFSYQTGGNYYGNISYNIGSTQMHRHYEGYTERKKETLTLWTSKESRYKKAPHTYEFLKNMLKK